MANYAAVNTAIRQHLFDNVPVQIAEENVAWPNMPFDPTNLEPQISLFINYISRERVTLGVGSKEYRVEGILTLSLFSPRDTHTIDHDTIADQLMGIYDELVLPATDVTVEFLETMNLGSAVDNDFWRSDLPTEFRYTEFL